MRKKKSLLLVLLPIIIVAVWLLASFGGQMFGRPIRAQYGAPPPDIRDSQIVRFDFGRRVFPFLSSSQEDEMLKFYKMYAEAQREFIKASGEANADEIIIGITDRLERNANRLGELLAKMHQGERLRVMEELAKRFPVQGVEQSTVQRLIWREAMKFTELTRIYQEEAAAGRLAAARARWLAGCASKLKIAGRLLAFGYSVAAVADILKVTPEELLALEANLSWVEASMRDSGQPVSLSSWLAWTVGLPVGVWLQMDLGTNLGGSSGRWSEFALDNVTLAKKLRGHPDLQKKYVILLTNNPTDYSGLKRLYDDTFYEGGVFGYAQAIQDLSKLFDPSLTDEEFDRWIERLRDKY